MLNINVDVDISVNKGLKFPIKLIGVNKCLHCGSEGTLKKVDIFGRPSVKDIYPLDHITCTNCNQDYSIEWKDNGTGELIPVPVDQSIKREFLNTMNYFKIRGKGQKEI